MQHFEKCYDIDELLHRNMHIHSSYSACAKPEMTFINIVREAERCGLQDIAITNHSDPGCHYNICENNKKLIKLRNETPSSVRVKIGAELSVYGVGKYSESPEFIKSLEYRLFAQNHYHLTNVWEQPEERTCEGYAKHMLAVLNELFNTDYADCIAHPFAPIKIKDLPESEKITGFISDEELGDIFEKSEIAGCAWELHKACVLGWPDFARRFFNIGREAGVHFTFASDAHRLCDIDPSPYIEQYKKILL